MFQEDEYFPVASPKLAAAARLKTPRDLLKARIIREDRDYWKQWFDAAGVPIEEAKAARGPLFNDSTYALQAAARGEGIALARRSIAQEDLDRGVLRPLFDFSVPSSERYWLVSPKELADTPKVRAFRDWIRAELKR